MSTAQDTKALFDDISRFVSESHALLKQGAVMELSGLDERVQHLCKAVAGLSPEESVRYADDLDRLRAELTQLGEALASHRDALAGDMRGLSEHRRANSAYRTAEASDNSGKK